MKKNHTKGLFDAIVELHVTICLNNYAEIIFYKRRSEDTNRQIDVNGKPEGFRMKNKNPILEVITKYKYRNESNIAKRAEIK